MVVATPEASYAQEPVPIVRGTGGLGASASAEGEGMRVVGPRPRKLGSIEIEVIGKSNR